MRDRVFAVSICLLCSCEPSTQRDQGSVEQVQPALRSAVVDLGTLGGARSSAVAVNNRGDVVGSSDVVTPDSYTHAFLWTQQDGMIDLGTLGGDRAVALALNDRRQVVGTSKDASEFAFAYRAFLWTESEGMKDLGTLGGYFGASAAVSINDKGDIVGYGYNAARGYSRALLWTRTGMVPLELPPQYAYSHACGINDSGLILGGVVAHESSGFTARAAVWRAPDGALVKVFEQSSSAGGLSNSGRIVGEAGHPFLWSAAQGLVDLPFGGYATAVNDSGDVVGSAYGEGSTVSPFRWTRTDGMTDLGTLGAPFAHAVAINNRGVVVGMRYASSSSYAFVWTDSGGMQDLGPGRLGMEGCSPTTVLSNTGYFVFTQNGHAVRASVP